MPTTRRRHIVTETEGIARALNDAAERWPQDADRRTRLLVHLVEEGHRAMIERSELNTSRRRDAIRWTSGALTGLYGEGYLERLREDWPA